jgi:hypothetical protein
VKADASEALLYLDWRALNGLRVGKTAADALANPGGPPEAMTRVPTSARTSATPPADHHPLNAIPRPP